MVSLFYGYADMDCRQDLQVLFQRKGSSNKLCILDQTKVRKIDVMLRATGKYKLTFASMKKR